MKLKNKKGEIEEMRYGPAQDAIAAGTHEVALEDAAGKVAVPGKAKSTAKG